MVPACLLPPVLPPRPQDNSSQLQAVDYEATLHQFDPTAAPEKQAKIAMDTAIAAGSNEQLKVVLQQIGQQLPQQTITLMMHALRSVGKQGNLAMMQLLLEEIKSCNAQQVFELMKYALDGAAAQENPSMMDFLLGTVQKVFHTAFPQQFFELLQHAVNTAAKQGNLGLLKFLMDHTAAALIPINYDIVFGHVVARGEAETLLKDAIIGGAPYENVILMLLQSVKNLPESTDSRLGSRQSLKNTAKVQLIKCYKQRDPALFAKLMAAIKSFFPEETAHVHSGVDGDVAM